jgi:hypothetical protein
MVADYDNWLTDLKTALDGDLAITLDERLKTIYNTATTDSPIIS